MPKRDSWSHYCMIRKAHELMHSVQFRSDCLDEFTNALRTHVEM